MAFQQRWLPLIQQALRRFFAGRGANNDITSLTGLTGPISAASRLVLSEQAILETPPFNAIGLGAIDVDGISSLVFKSPTGFESRLMRDRHFVARNNTGTTITRGTVVVVTGVSGNGSGASLLVSRAQSNGTIMMPAAGIAAQDIPNNSTGRCIANGKLIDVNTSAFAALDILFVSPTVAGGLTNVRPSTPNRAQPIGQVVNSNSTSGAILVNIQPVLNESLSTIQNTYTIGDATAGVKALRFAGTTVRSLYDGATAPATQLLLVGDTWTERNATTQAVIQEWEWNGTYWLSKQIYRSTYNDEVLYSTVQNLIKTVSLDGLSNVFLTTIAVNYLVETTNDATNFWTINGQYRRRTGSFISLGTAVTTGSGVSFGAIATITANTHLVVGDTESNRVLRTILGLTPTGTPGGFRLLGCDYFYRWARK